VIHLSDSAAAFIGVLVGPTLVLAGALMSDNDLGSLVRQQRSRGPALRARAQPRAALGRA
jgi:hypothetical protein